MRRLRLWLVSKILPDGLFVDKLPSSMQFSGPQTWTSTTQIDEIEIVRGT